MRPGVTGTKTKQQAGWWHEAYRAGGSYIVTESHVRSEWNQHETVGKKRQENEPRSDQKARVAGQCYGSSIELTELAL